MLTKARKIIRYILALSYSALVTAIFLPVRELLGNAATVALVYIFVVVIVAIRWGMGPSLVTSMSAMINFNFFFLQPYYTFIISGYDDIVFYLAFFATSLAVGNLSAQAKKRADVTETQLEEIESLYADLQRESNERERAEENVHRLNEELEQKIVQLQDAQEELVRKEKLSILGQLSGSVGHELRNPLGVMSNAVYFLKAVQGDADETVKEYLGILENEIANSQRIITDLLDFARTKPPSRQAVTPGELVRLSLKRCTIPETVTLTVEVPEDLPKLNVDLLQMGQVLTNFVTNGVQAMSGGGALRVAARRVMSEESLARHTSPDFIEISVTDTGEGITPENMKKLFQPLFTTKAKGVGLGLVVCGNLAAANGGAIRVASGVGKGTTFSVVLPVEGGQT